MRHASILLAPLLLGALYGADASGATLLSREAALEASPQAASEAEALETPAPPDELAAAGADTEEARGPRLDRLVSVKGDPDPFAPPPPTVLADDPPSDEKTPPPTAAEWRDALAVLPARSLDRPGCRFLRVREWLRVTCPINGQLAAMDLLTGSREGVSFEPGTKPKDDPGVTFPVRRGDRRVFQVVKVGGFSKYTTEYDVAFTVSEDWFAEARGPTVVVD